MRKLINSKNEMIETFETFQDIYEDAIKHVEESFSGRLSDDMIDTYYEEYCDEDEDLNEEEE